MKNVQRGQKFIIIQDFPTHALTSWGKPCTGSEACVIPKGTILIADGDQLPGTRGFGVIPEKYKEMESVFISQETLSDKDYSDYYY